MITPLFFGTKNKQSPFPKINFISSGISTTFFSRTNYNLFLTPSEINYVSYGTLLEKSNSPSLIIPSQPLSNKTNELSFSPEICYSCAETNLGCPLIVKSRNTKIVEDTENLTIDIWDLKDEIEISDWDSSCPFFISLLDITETDSERRFLKLFLDKHLMYYVGDLYERMIDEARWFVEGIQDIFVDILKLDF